jgi:CheY-like chemotaxis protein
MMDGKIWIESELGEGSAFVFTVQLKRVHEKESMLPDWNNVRILAVDDDPNSLEYLREVVEGYGASCDTAPSGADALRLVEKSDAYHVYIVDYRMPGMDGIELTRILKAMDRKVPVVMVSAAEWSAIEEEAGKAGVDKFLPKPIFPSCIVDAVNRILGVDQEKVGQVQESYARQFTGQHILLAEDVDINREIVQALLEPLKLKIDCAENGEEAVRMFRESGGRYDMIFMDVQMPKMDGYEATRQIRQLDTPDAKSIPIVAMTANVFHEDVEKCLACGMDGHVGKPLDFDSVFSKLREYMTR